MEKSQTDWVSGKLVKADMFLDKVINSFPPLKQIPNYPGFSVSRDGVVYSSRNSSKGTPKPVKINCRGKVTLTGPGYQKVRDPKEIAREVWKLTNEQLEVTDGEMALWNPE